MDSLMQFRLPLPKYKNQIISLNNISRWFRYSGSKLKNEFKDRLRTWYIPEPTVKHDALTIEFRLYRHNNRMLDTDNIGIIIKWTIDAIKESGWLTDDDRITYTVYPAITDRELVETSLEVTVFESKEES